MTAMTSNTENIMRQFAEEKAVLEAAVAAAEELAKAKEIYFQETMNNLKAGARRALEQYRSHVSELEASVKSALDGKVEGEKFRSCVSHLNAIVQALEESDALCHDSNFRTAMAKAEKAIFNGNREIQKSPIFQRAWEQSLVEDSRTPADAQEARKRVLDGGRSETLFAEIHGHDLTKYQQLESRFEEVVRAWTDQKQKITNQQQEIDWMRREAAELISRNQALRDELNESEAQVEFLEDQRIEWRNRTEDAQNEAEEARTTLEAAKTRHLEEIEKYRVCCNDELYEREKMIAHLRDQIDGNHRQFSALDELLTEHGNTIYTTQNEVDPYRRAECLLDLAAQVKKINERLQIARRSVPDPDERSSQRAGFALMQLDRTVYESDDEDVPRTPPTESVESDAEVDPPNACTTSTLRKDFTCFLNNDCYHKLHLRATEIDDFPSSVITWLENQVSQQEGWTISFMEAFYHPCITITKPTVGEVMVERY